MARWWPILLILLIVAPVAAQDDTCPTMQEEALANILARCVDQAASTLCFGHPTVSAVPRPGLQITDPFHQPGDAISLASLDWLSISTEASTWGAARAIFPAYPQDGLEARPSALLAIGNVALFFPEPAQLPATFADIEVSTAQGAYLRELPNTEARAVAPLAVSSKLRAIGRSEDGQWLLIYISPDLRGWISQEVVTAPAAALPAMAIDTPTTALWLPWQTFDFRSGIDDAPCAGAPASGILLQAPKFISPRRFHINGARISLAGTAWLQAQVGVGMRIHMLDGSASISARNSAVAVRSGNFTNVPLALDENGAVTAAEPPSAPAPYDYHALSGLPIHLLIYESRVGLELYTVVSPAPESGGSPLERLSPEDECRIAAGLAGANIRSRPYAAAPVIAIMGYRESAKPVARGIGSEQLPWWKLDEGIWIRVDATVSGGNCNDLPLILPGN